MTAPTLDVDTLRKGALKALREGRVRICSVGYDGGRKAVTAAAEVHGHTGVHQVSYMSDRWSCSCASLGPCAHVRAVQQVTGHADAPSRHNPQQVVEEAVLRSHAALIATSGWRAAAFAFRCGRCGHAWQPGDPVGYADDAWLGACCSEVAR